MFLISIILGAIAIVLLLPLFSDALSLSKTVLRRAAPPAPADENARLLFLVPAHNESGMITRCVDSLMAQSYPRELFDVVVIADNCTDDTAELASARGARCLVRDDPQNPGKPRAIAHAIDVLPIADYTAMVIIDADAVVDPAFASGIAQVPDLRNSAAQSYNDVSNPGENALTRLAILFGAARYDFAFPLKQRAGLNVPIQGNGMCMGTGLLASHGWGAFSICEDWEIYVQLTEAGHKTRLAAGARVFAHEATTLKESSSQRKRWSGGKITVFLNAVPRILRSRNISWHQKLDTIGELASVGPAVHVGVVSILIAAALLLSVPGAKLIAAGLALSLVRTATWSLFAFSRIPEPGRALLAFAYFPFYIVWRLGVQVGALMMVGDRPWVRTGRPA